MHSCFDHLRGAYSRQQALNIMLGVATIKWMEQSEKYYRSAGLIIQALMDPDHLGYEIKRHEAEYPEFKGILSTLLSRLFENPGSYLSEICGRMSSKEIQTQEDYLNLINQIAQYNSKDSGFNKTPDSITRLVVKLLDLYNISSLADFSAGRSSIALEIFKQISHQPYYYAEEINTTEYLISKLLMIVNEIREYEIANKDIFTLEMENESRRFDLVISDIPRNMKYNKSFNPNDPRFRYGAPTKSNLEWAFIQNVIYHLNWQGKGIIVGSKGMLVRGLEDEIRARVVKEDLVECVITLPDNLYENTNIGSEVMIINHNKPVDRKGGVLFINASNYKKRLNSNQQTITKEGVNKITEAYRNNILKEDFSKFVNIEKMEEYGYRLNPVEYIDFENIKNQFNRTVPLGDIAEIARGVNIGPKEMEKLEEGGDYCYINARNVDDSGINYEDATMIQPKGMDWFEKYSIKADDIIITAKGWETKVALVDSAYKDSFISSNLTRIRVNSNKYNPYILLEYLKSDIGKRMLESLQTGTTVTLINNKQLSRLEVPVYSKEMMEETGQAIKANRKIYQERLNLAEKEYKEKQAQLMVELGLNKSI